MQDLLKYLAVINGMKKIYEW